MDVFTASGVFKHFVAFNVLAACGSFSDAVAKAEGRPLEWLYLQPEHAVARMWPSAEYVARNEDEWGRAWDEGRAMDPPDEGAPRNGRPFVDFSRYMVIGVSRGHGYSGCHGLYVRDIVERASFIEVQFVHRQPEDEVSKPGQGVGQMCTAMGVFLTRWVRVPKSGKPVRFVGG